MCLLTLSLQISDDERQRLSIDAIRSNGYWGPLTQERMWPMAPHFGDTAILTALHEDGCMHETSLLVQEVIHHYESHRIRLLFFVPATEYVIFRESVNWEMEND